MYKLYGNIIIYRLRCNMYRLLIVQQFIIKLIYHVTYSYNIPVVIIIYNYEYIKKDLERLVCMICKNIFSYRKKKRERERRHSFFVRHD